MVPRAGAHCKRASRRDLGVFERAMPRLLTHARALLPLLRIVSSLVCTVVVVVVVVKPAWHAGWLQQSI